ncbi:hypothetical protein H4Q26_000357 [Puccinia striiformis f. sp. tritici PST-130]|nr:hypothetical protein H4Q26_000357 [Puccinia striiformis f. sp. tritici PST-130]
MPNPTQSRPSNIPINKRDANNTRHREEGEEDRFAANLEEAIPKNVRPIGSISIRSSMSTYSIANLSEFKSTIPIRSL